MEYKKNIKQKKSTNFNEMRLKDNGDKLFRVNHTPKRGALRLKYQITMVDTPGYLFRQPKVVKCSQKEEKKKKGISTGKIKKNKTS